MTETPDQLAKHLLQLERQLLEPSTRRDPAAIASLLAADFREFGSSGRIYGRQQIIDELAVESPRHLTLEDAEFRRLPDDTALLTYRSTRAIPFEPAVHTNRSSLWVRREGRWQMVFHQGTQV